MNSAGCLGTKGKTQKYQPSTHTHKHLGSFKDTHYRQGERGHGRRVRGGERGKEVGRERIAKSKANNAREGKRERFEREGRKDHQSGNEILREG